ncbi:MAG: CBS domain-containing protein [Sulfolobales archaeon]|nr:CBS domain-containing protein [Sulfolobales archaeon]MCX8186251.1 CBS domain-containing protein [Sulfolobales archaeon]MDW7969013.1 CBS domain-containing protein [Sulfolobales archaeon]
MVPKVSSYMSAPVITATKEDPLTHIRNLMLAHKIGRVVITEDGEVTGIVCKSDFAKIAFNRRRYVKPLDTIAVDEIMTTPVYAIPPNKTLKSAAHSMIKYEISSLPVIDKDKKLVGIITKYDVLRFFSSRFHNIFRVSDFMVKDPPTVSPTHSIYYIIDALMQSELKRLIVVDGGKPIGVIAKVDVLNALLGVNIDFQPFKRKRRNLNYDLLISRSFLVASDVMTYDPITVEEGDDLARASDIMIKNRISCLPVINSKGFLVGLISRECVIKALREI